MIKIENIKSVTDIERFIEGCINDFELGIITKDEMSVLMIKLIQYMLQLLIEKNK